MKEKTMSGSSRDKSHATPKQNKWNNPFYCESHGASKITKLHSHKVDSTRASVQNMFKSMLTAVSSFFNRVFRRKVIA